MSDDLFVSWAKRLVEEGSVDVWLLCCPNPPKSGPSPVAGAPVGVVAPKEPNVGVPVCGATPNSDELPVKGAAVVLVVVAMVGAGAVVA